MIGHIATPVVRPNRRAKHWFLALAATAWLGLFPALGNAQDSLRAAAVVNDEVISILDVIMRIRLVIIGAGFEDTPETRDRIGRQVLDRLIDERLQLQEAARLDIKISEDQVDEALSQLASQNSMSRDEFLNALQRSRILPTVLTEQIRAELAWRAIVQLRLMPSVAVSEEEVEAVVQRISSRDTGNEYRVAEIFLAVEDPSQEAVAQQRAERLVAEARAGANFAGLARQFSQGSAAQLGGDLGWIPGGRLPDQLDQALKTLSPGQVSPPIRTLTGFSILLLRDIRSREEEDIDRGSIERNLMERRLGQLAQRSLQELRRTANIDIRI